MQSQSYSPEWNGYLLLEVMIMLALLGAFALIATKLLSTSMRASIDAEQARETALRFDLAMTRIRADVWSARAIESDGLSATLHLPGGENIVWRAEPADPADSPPAPPGPTVSLVREIEPVGAATANPAADRTRWDRLPPIAFEARGPMLRIRAPVASDAATTGELTLVSQLRLAEATP